MEQLSQHLRFQTNILANPEATQEMRNPAWLNATDALIQMEYLTGLQKHTAARLEEQLQAERAQEEERARRRSVMGRLRTLFSAGDRIEEPAA